MEEQAEVWKPIDGAPGYYVSNLGGVISERTGTKNFLRPTPKKKYLYVSIRFESGRRLRPVHRLVAIAFIPNPKNAPQVNHIDFDRTNNKVSNLEWVTGYENHLHSIKAGRAHPLKPQKQIYLPKQRGKKIYIYNLKGKYITYAVGLQSVCKSERVGLKALGTAIKNKKPIGKYIYSYEKHDSIEPPKNKPYKLPFDFTIKRHKSYVPVFCIKNGQVIAYYQSVALASERLNIKAKKISSVLSGEYKSTHGYSFARTKFL